MERQETIGFQIRTLSVGIKRAVDASKSRSGDSHCTGTHGWVIGYLYENRHKDVYQRDMEKQFSVRRSTMTEILKLMEKNGLVERIKDENDARLKKIKLTETALKIHEKHEKDIANFENYIRQGISDQEMKTFFEIIGKISENVQKAEKEHIFNWEEK